MNNILSIDQLFSETDGLAQAAHQVSSLASHGLAVTVDPDVADYMAAFPETALSYEDAQESLVDVDPQTGVVISADGEIA
ncbi:hypothetical protein [Kiloniella laminariae]|uniref:hypothetical protein n=1 Tax=Kiloniella laminariae TaxID=454162 RepID=UPI00038125B0|nr:hypothetical protein [Kiloniella laminariae]